MKNRSYIVLGAVVLLAAGFVIYSWPGIKPPAPSPAETKPPVGEVSSAAPEHPVPDAKEVAARADQDGGDVAEAPAPVDVADAPLPTNLDNSDPSTLEALARLLGKERVDALIISEGFIRRFVVTVENASGSAIPSQSSVFKPPPLSLAVERNEVGPMLSPKNYDRYRELVSALSSVNSKSLVMLYTRFYPYLQSAYAELGMSGYFNDRLIAAIDKALAAPTPVGPIQLVENGYFKFVDPELEKLSAVQKLMIRIGPDQAAVVKQKLKRIRRLLVK